MFEELACATYQLEGEITQGFKPNVVNAGSVFIDDFGQKHTYACGWLAIHAALHMSYYLGTMPEHLVEGFTRRKLLPGSLKYASGARSLDARITGENIRLIAEGLGIRIIVNEVGNLHYYGAGSGFEIVLWLSQAHYTVLLDYEGCRNDDYVAAGVRFATRFASLGYETKTLEPLSDEERDRTYAIQVQEHYDRMAELNRY